MVGADGPAHDVHGHLHAVGDGLVTTQPGVSLMVRAADCVPVLFADESGTVIGAAHCGRPGLVAGIVPATVAAMRSLGAGPLRAWVGPHVCGRCYEVPEQMRDDVAAVEPDSRATTSWGTPSLDVGAGVRAQLERDERRGGRPLDLHARVARPLLLPPRRPRVRPPGGHRPDRVMSESARREEITNGLDADAEAHRRSRQGGRTRPRRGDPGGCHQALPRERRADPRRPRGDRHRREPASRGRRQARRVR